MLSDMGGALYGKYMRTSILISLTVSQIGFVCGKLRVSCYYRARLMSSLHHLYCSKSASLRIGRHRLQDLHPDQVYDPR